MPVSFMLSILGHSHLPFSLQTQAQALQNPKRLQNALLQRQLWEGRKVQASALLRCSVAAGAGA